MRDREALRARYTRDGLPVRLGGLAANLARISTFSDHPGHRDVVERLVEESEFFIEWTAPELSLEPKAELVEYQRALAVWHYAWGATWADPSRRTEMAERAGQWAQRVLEMSGLGR